MKTNTTSGPRTGIILRMAIANAPTRTVAHEAFHIIDFCTNISTDKINTNYFNTNLDTAIELMKSSKCHEKKDSAIQDILAFAIPRQQMKRPTEWKCGRYLPAGVILKMMISSRQ
ncbi:MAG: hypothetical protein BWY43_00086 [candidate division WS2 bacterium ADurb.Bin280]|uniref:Uncharacterized protein n=1 Tax=candidate division WS2 bacterium ADurb.Bin280 TaxID=1852829 RepID=A0A1V5SFT4_9BACT|nr:MAG: hypothetical protein BWY43_00086 [candidate division WS2 bacterium ADurb.Bin280]